MPESEVNEFVLSFVKQEIKLMIITHSYLFEIFDRYMFTNYIRLFYKKGFPFLSEISAIVTNRDTYSNHLRRF